MNPYSEPEATTCVSCGREFDPVETPGARPYAVGGGGPGGYVKLYVCSRKCYQAESTKAARTVPCFECGKPFMLAPDDKRDRPGRMSWKFCSSGCRKTAEKRRDTVWKAAGKFTIPTTDKALGDLAAAVATTLLEVTEKHITTPERGHMRLATYATELEAEKEARARRARFAAGDIPQGQLTLSRHPGLAGA